MSESWEIKGEAKVRAALDALDATYEVLPCDPELADTQAFCAYYGISSVVIGGGSRSCKIRLAPAVLDELPQAHVVDDLALPPE